MTTLREAAQQALEAMEELQGGCTDSDDGTVEAITVWCPEVITALRTALSEPEQEPVAYLYHDAGVPEDAHPWLHSTMLVLAADRRPGLRGETPLYTHPPQRKPLTDEEIVDLWADVSMDYDDQINIIEMARAIERAHGIGGEA